jgi:hypothetical protein
LIQDDKDQHQEGEDNDEVDDTASAHGEGVTPRAVTDAVTCGIKVDSAVGVKLLYNTLAVWYVKFRSCFNANARLTLHLPFQSGLHTGPLISRAAIFGSRMDNAKPVPSRPASRDPFGRDFALVALPRGPKIDGPVCLRQRSLGGCLDA